MRINQVVLVPETDFSHPEEKDVIDQYMRSIVEFLDEDRIPARIFNDYDSIFQNTLVLYCQAGWGRGGVAKAKSNLSVVQYGTKETAGLAHLMSEALAEWGKSYVDFHHKSANARNDAANLHINIAGAFGLSISPFKLNGPNADLYMQKLDLLGKSIAACIFDFMLSRGEQPRVMNASMGGFRHL